MITPGFSTSYVQTPVSKRSHSKEGSTMDRVCHSRLQSMNRCRNCYYSFWWLHWNRSRNGTGNWYTVSVFFLFFSSNKKNSIFLTSLCNASKSNMVTSSMMKRYCENDWPLKAVAKKRHCSKVVVLQKTLTPNFCYIRNILWQPR